jgi:uncharacterized protein (UPF0335 family)
MTQESMKELYMRTEKTAFMAGALIGQLATLIRSIENTPMESGQILEEIKEVWRQATLQMHSIYYSNP